MFTWIPWAAAVVSTAVCLWLWFREVRRIMVERTDMLSSAAGQLESSRKRAEDNPTDGEAAAVYRRSEDIYRQAQYQYRRSLCRPWIALPAYLMGYRAERRGEINQK